MSRPRYGPGPKRPFNWFPTEPAWSGVVPAGLPAVGVIAVSVEIGHPVIIIPTAVGTAGDCCGAVLRTIARLGGGSTSLGRRSEGLRWHFASRV